MSKGERRVTNTAKEVDANPERFLLEGIIFGGSAAIERQEAQGQTEICAATDLPTEGSEHPAFAAMGIVFEKPHDDDSLFRPARLPTGWRIIPTDHSMWSHLLDANGCRRASIFYKAAFYDRRAFIRPDTRYGTTGEVDAKEWIFYDVIDQAVLIEGKPATLFRIEHTSRTSEGTPDWIAPWDLAAAWLDEHFPDWNDPCNYWPDLRTEGRKGIG